MPLVVKDRVRETTTTTGTGTVSLIGAVTGYQSFSVIGNGNTTFYTIALDSAGEWEVGIGTYTASGTTLSRDIVLESSNSGSLVPFSSGTKTVFVTYPAEKSVYFDAAGAVNVDNLSLDGNTIASTNTNGSVTIAPNGTGQIVLTSSSQISMSATSSLQKNSTNAYALKNIVYLTSGTAATYTTPTGVRALKVTVVGGGGGGGGVDGVATASTNAMSGGGGGAGYATAFIGTAEASYTYTVGSGGTGGAAGNNAGAAGGTTEFKNAGSTVIITGGGGGGGSGSLGAVSASSTPGTPGVGSITGLGSPGGIIGEGTAPFSNYGRIISGTVYNLNTSGSCPIVGGGVDIVVATTGSNATIYGEGGGGVRTTTAIATNYAGGNGFAGLIVIEEYY
jgi:hypothetical protein